MNFFDWLNKAFEDDKPKATREQTTTAVVDVPKKSAEEIYEIYHKDPLKTPTKPQRNLSLEMVLMLTISNMEAAQKAQWPLPDARQAAYEKYLKLCRQNQGESDYAKRQLALAGDYPTQINQAREAHQLLYFMKSVWSHFGSQTLIMKPDDFAEVCRKYKLVAGNLSDYIGEIPLTNKTEIENAKLAFKGYGKDVSNPTYVQAEVPYFLDWGGALQYSIYWHSGEARINDNGWFIAAPREAFREKPKLTIDPFVFTVSELGYVLIHAKWGTEAEDATIKRYEQLRDAIIGNSKSLTV